MVVDQPVSSDLGAGGVAVGQVAFKVCGLTLTWMTLISQQVMTPEELEELAMKKKFAARRRWRKACAKIQSLYRMYKAGQRVSMVGRSESRIKSRRWRLASRAVHIFSHSASTVMPDRVESRVHELRSRRCMF